MTLARQWMAVQGFQRTCLPATTAEKAYEEPSAVVIVAPAVSACGSDRCRVTMPSALWSCPSSIVWPAWPAGTACTAGAGAGAWARAAVGAGARTAAPTRAAVTVRSSRVRLEDTAGLFLSATGPPGFGSPARYVIPVALRHRLAAVLRWSTGPSECVRLCYRSA